MTQNDFYSAMYQANMLYGTSFTNVDDFAEIALIAWSKIGNKNYRLYKYDGHVDPEELTITLPCNCDIIEAVVAPHEDWSYTSNVLNDGDWATAWTEEYIERRKRHHHSQFYTHGHFIHYQRLGNKLYFEHPYPFVRILYKGVEVDDEGLPYLNDREVEAVALFVAYVQTQKEGLQSMNGDKLKMAQELEKRWLIAWHNAKMPEDVSQNEMNEILDCKSRWVNKVYGRSFKPLMK